MQLKRARNKKLWNGPICNTLFDLIKEDTPITFRRRIAGRKSTRTE